MFAKLSALTGLGGPALNYKIEDAYSSAAAWGSWTHHAGTSNEDGSAVSIFRLSANDPNDLKLVAARNGVKRLRMVGTHGAGTAAFGCMIRVAWSAMHAKQCPGSGAPRLHGAANPWGGACTGHATGWLVSRGQGWQWARPAVSLAPGRPAWWRWCSLAAAPPQCPGLQGQH